jgi:hypothetical protein
VRARAIFAPFALAAVLASPSAARADDVDQSSQMMFGVQASYVPQQHALTDDVLALGHYVAFSHRFDFFFVGLRAAFAYGWLPSGNPGQQWILEANAFVGGHLPIGKRFALRGELGIGPLVNGGEGFATAGIAHSYLRASAQLVVVKSFTLEAFAGPSVLIGTSVASVFPDLGLGAGWNF